MILWPVAYQKLIFWGLFCCCDDPSKFCCCVFMNSIVQNRNFEDSEIVQWWNNLDCLRCLAPRTWDLSHYMLQDREWHGPVHCNCGTVTYILFQTMLLQHVDIIIVAGVSSADPYLYFSWDRFWPLQIMTLTHRGILSTLTFKAKLFILLLKLMTKFYKICATQLILLPFYSK